MARMSDLHELVGSDLVSRGAELLKSGNWADVEFLVGEKKESIKAHRLILATASPVFASMLYGPHYQADRPIDIPDVEPEMFQLLLEYFYTGAISSITIDQLTDFMGLCKKYELPNLPRACATAYTESVNSENALRLYDLAVLAKDPGLMDKVDLIFQMHPKEVLQTWDENYNIEALVRLFSSDLLKIDSEVDLLDFLDRLVDSWKADLDNKLEGNTAANAKIYRLLKEIRFLSMDSKQLTGIRERLRKYLSESDLLSLFMNLSSPGDVPLPKSISNDRAPRNLKTPFTLPLPYPRTKEITIKGYLAEDYQRFDINLQYFPTPILETANYYRIALTISVRRHERQTVFNSFHGHRGWRRERRRAYFPFKAGGHFVIKITVTPEKYCITVNGEQYANFKHRMPYIGCSFVGVHNDVAISSISFSDDLYDVQPFGDDIGYNNSDGGNDIDDNLMLG